MSSGQKRMIQHSRERLLSTDFNREYSFIGHHQAEMLGRWYLAANGETALVLEGLLPRPLNGSTTLRVDAGVVVMLDPDSPADPDDSDYKIIIDAGQPLAGVLTLTGNSSGATRVDIIECSRIELTVESDNRDFFDPSTGLFTVASVSKVTKGALTYRVRTGIPGGGFPGLAAGWLPLAVSTVPDGSTVWDTCTIWDVRPLSSDLIDTADRLIPQAQVYTDLQTGGEARVRGIVETSLNGRRAGGQLTMGVPGTQTDWVDILASSNREPGYIALPDALWHLWLAFPFGLPTWRRYSDASLGGRTPRECRGIPILSAKSPANASGVPSSALVLPTATGFAATTSDCVLAVAGLHNATPSLFGTDVDGHMSRIQGFTAPVDILPASTTVNSATFDLVDGTHHPANARALWLRFTGTVTKAGAAEGALDRRVSELDPTLAGIVFTVEHGPVWLSSAGALSYGEKFEVRIPLAQTNPTQLGLYTRRVTWTHFASSNLGASMGTPLCFVIGWEI